MPFAEDLHCLPCSENNCTHPKKAATWSMAPGCSIARSRIEQRRNHDQALHNSKIRRSHMTE